MTNFFVKYVFAPFILILGLIGNPMGLIVIGRKKLEKIGPVLIYKFLFIFDTIYLSMIFIYIHIFN
jgi:hypothetical protein